MLESLRSGRIPPPVGGVVGLTVLWGVAWVTWGFFYDQWCMAVMMTFTVWSLAHMLYRRDAGSRQFMLWIAGSQVIFGLVGFFIFPAARAVENLVRLMFGGGIVLLLTVSSSSKTWFRAAE